MSGKLYPSGSLILRNGNGTAKVGERGYELDTTLHGQPCIRSKQTGKYYVVSWEELLEMAIAAGIDDRGIAHAA